MTMGLLLMAAALFLAGMNLYEERQGERAAEAVLAQMKLPEAVETPGVVDADGAPMNWPMRADGRPAAWPTDADGMPMRETTDETGAVCIWPDGADAVQWERDENGALLPFVGGASGLRAAWPTDATGALLSWEKMLDWWTQLLGSAWERLTLADTPTFIRHPDMEMPTTKIDGRYYIGLLEVPDKNLKLPIMSDWSEQNLKISPCRYDGSAYAGDLVIAGHNYYRHFSPVKRLEVGAEVRFTDVDGNVFIYEVTALETLDGSDTEGMLVGDWALTLFTCTTGGRSRVAVRCALTGIVPA